MRVGMTTQEDQRFFGRTLRDTWEVTEYEPSTILAYRATSGSSLLAEEPESRMPSIWSRAVFTTRRCVHDAVGDPAGPR